MSTLENVLAACNVAVSTYVLYHLLFKRSNERRYSNIIEDKQSDNFPDFADVNSLTKREEDPEVNLQQDVSGLQNKETIPCIRSNSAVSAVGFSLKELDWQSRCRSEPQIRLEKPESLYVVEKSTTVVKESEYRMFEEVSILEPLSKGEKESDAGAVKKENKCIGPPFCVLSARDDISSRSQEGPAAGCTSVSQDFDFDAMEDKRTGEQLSVIQEDNSDFMMHLLIDAVLPSPLRWMMPNDPIEMLSRGAGVAEELGGATDLSETFRELDRATGVFV